MLSNKHSTLFFRGIDAGPVTADPRLALEKDHYPVVSWPTKEVGSNLAEVAVAFLDRTASPGWHESGRRKITHGDLFTYRGAIYMYAFADKVPDLVEKGTTAVKLYGWGHMLLLSIRRKQPKELACDIN